MNQKRKPKPNLTLPGFVMLLSGILFTAVQTFSVAAIAQTLPKLTTNQSLIDNHEAGNSLEISNVEDAFEFVFSNLPDEVFVYPTENYYYFTFPADGIIYAGNLRLAAQDRDTGIIHFAAFRQANQTSDAGDMLYRAMSASDGVEVEKLNEFAYRVTYKNKTVTFQLNDVSSITPPANIVAEGEEYLGLVYDESGVRFFLFYNSKHKVFAYVLDETVKTPDQFFEVDGTAGRISVGLRTGFAFYKHHHLDRRMLIGVHGANTIVNNYFDGPADQLPENHIVQDNLRRSIEDYDPNVKDMLDTFGYFKTGEGRYLITPYIQYLALDDLAGYHQCATGEALRPEIYDACFYAGEE